MEPDVTKAQLVTPKSLSTFAKRRKHFIRDFAFGGIAGIISKTVVAPIERVKLLMQTQHENLKVKKRYNGIFDCFIRTMREDGVLGLWRGNFVNVVRYFPTQALSFAFKDQLNSLFHLRSVTKQQKAYYLFIRVLNGGLAGAFTTLFVYPLDFARTRIGVDIGKSLQQRQFTGLRDCLSKTYKNQGIRGLYRGLLVGIPSIFLYRGFYFGIYDTGKQIILDKHNLFAKFLWAQFSVMLSQAIAYPGDTIKRKLMMQSLKAQKQYTGMIDCFQKTVKAEGYKGLWRGGFTNILRSVGSSLCLILYDQFRKSFMNMNV